MKGIKISSIVIGIQFLTAGVLLIAFNSGLLPIEYKKIVFSSQMLLIAIGFTFLFSRHKWIGGLILIFIGGFFLIPKLSAIGFNIVPQHGIALALIVVGVIVLCNSLFVRRKNWFWKEAGWQNWHKRETNGKESGYINCENVFGGGNEKLGAKIFRGGEITNVFGGMEFDLSDAQLAEGANYLELNSVFGGVVLIVPIDWKIELRQTQVFGSFVDNRPKPGFEIDENKLLIIEANSVFGGGEIKCN